MTIHYTPEKTTVADAELQTYFELGYANGLKGIKVKKSPGTTQEQKANYRYGFNQGSKLVIL